jgi:hypothetical protein
MPAGTVVVEEDSSWLKISQFAITFVCSEDKAIDIT